MQTRNQAVHRGVNDVWRLSKADCASQNVWLLTRKAVTIIKQARTASVKRRAES